MKTIAGEIERLQQILDKNHDSIYFARLADYLRQSNRISEAIDVCKRGLEQHPQYANAHYVLGHCYYLIHDYDAAESEFNKVLLHDSEHLNAHHFQAKIMKERGWQNAYLLWLKRILAIDSQDRLAQSLMADSVQNEEERLAAGGEAQTFFPPEIDQPMDQKAESGFKEVESVFAEGQEEESGAGEDDEESDSGAGKPASAMSKTEDTEKYGFILDDIFKDEVAQEEPTETVTDELPVESDKMFATPPAEDEEIISRIRDQVQQFEQEETTTDLDRETEELLPESGAPAEPAAEISMDEKGRIAREVFGDENVTEPTEVPESEILPETDYTEPAPAATEPVIEEKPAPPPIKEPIVTSTLGEIYAAQGHFAKAIGVYEILLRKHPDNESYKAKIEELKRKLAEMENQQQ